jgi:hypothetical protein
MILRNHWYAVVGCLIWASIHSGCAENQDARNGKAEGRRNLRDESRLFILRDEFEAPQGSTYFRPETPPADIHDYLSSRYNEDRSVRRLIATYFLRYEAKLLSRGLLAADSREGDLIALLWNMEARRGFAQVESPGMSAMREHIRANSDWFGINEDDLELLRSNEAKLRALYGTAPSGGTSPPLSRDCSPTHDWQHRSAR